VGAGWPPQAAVAGDEVAPKSAGNSSMCVLLWDTVVGTAHTTGLARGLAVGGGGVPQQSLGTRRDYYAQESGSRGLSIDDY